MRGYAVTDPDIRRRHGEHSVLSVPASFLSIIEPAAPQPPAIQATGGSAPAEQSTAPKLGDTLRHDRKDISFVPWREPHTSPIGSEMPIAQTNMAPNFGSFFLIVGRQWTRPVHVRPLDTVNRYYSNYARKNIVRWNHINDHTVSLADPRRQDIPL
jgi:hypothetical protein